MLGKRSFPIFVLFLVALVGVVFTVIGRHEKKEHYLAPKRVMPALQKTGYRFTFKERGVFRAGSTQFIGTAYGRGGVALRFAILVGKDGKKPIAQNWMVGAKKGSRPTQTIVRNIAIMMEQSYGFNGDTKEKEAIRDQMAVDIESKVFRLITKNPFFDGD